MLRTSALTQQSPMLRISITIRACAIHILVGFLKVIHQFENPPVHVIFGIIPAVEHNIQRRQVFKDP